VPPRQILVRTAIHIEEPEPPVLERPAIDMMRFVLRAESR